MKIERAEKHLADLKIVLATIPDLTTAFIEPDSEGRGHRIEHDVPNLLEIQNRIALIIGDCIHNLRSALDFVWYEIAITLQLVTPEKFIKFPVYRDGKELEFLLKDRKIDVLNPKLFQLMIRDIKPYRTGNDPIWALHNLDIADKHKLLLPLVQRGSISGITVKDETGEISGGTWSLAAPPPYRIDIPTPHHIKDKGKLKLSIVFDKGTPLQHREVSRELLSLLEIVKQTVESLEGTV